MSDLESTAEATLPEPPSKRRKVHDGSGESTPRYETADEGEDKPTLQVSIRERRKSASGSPSPAPSRRREDEEDYYSSDHTRHSRSRSSSRYRSPTRSRSRSPTHSRSDSESPSRSRSATGSQSPRSPREHETSQTPAERTGEVSSDAQAPLQPIRPRFASRLILNGHQRPVSQVRLSPDGCWIASASADGSIKVWDATTGEHMDTLVGHMAGVSTIAWAPDSKILASGSDDKAIWLWDRTTGQPAKRRPLKGHHSYVACLAFSPKGNILASGSYDEAVFLWDVRAGRLMRSLPAHSDPVSGIDFCRDGTLVVSCSTDGLTRIWDTSTGQCLRTMVHEDNPAVTSVCFAPNGRYVLAFSTDSCIRLWDYVSGTVKKTYQGHVNAKYSIGGCFAELDGAAFVATASEDGGVVLWDVKSKEVAQRIEHVHKGVCFWVDICGETMVSCGEDGKIRVYRHHGLARPNKAVEATANGKEASETPLEEPADEAKKEEGGASSASPLEAESEIKKEE